MEELELTAVPSSVPAWRTVVAPGAGAGPAEDCCDHLARASITVMDAPLDSSEANHCCLHISDDAISDFSVPADAGDGVGSRLGTSLKIPLEGACSNPAAVTQNVEEFMAYFSTRRCHLCRRKKSFDLPQSLLLHVHKFHLHKAVRVGGYVLLRCHMLCGPRSAHYHCPHCPYTSCGMADIKRHALDHQRHRKSLTPSSQTPWTAPAEIGTKSESELDESGSSDNAGASSKGERFNHRLEDLHKSSENDCILQSSPNSRKPTVLNLSNNRNLCNERVLRERNGTTLLETHLKSEELIKEIKEEPPPFTVEDSVDAVEVSAPVDFIAVKLEEEEEEAAADVCLNVCASDQTPCNWRLSLPASLQEAFDKLSFDTCYLCSQGIKFESKTLLEVHFFRHHVRQSIDYTDDSVGLVCNLGCCGLSQHSHCPRCSFLAEDLLEVRSHYAEYHSRNQKDVSKNDPVCRGSNTRILAGITGLECPPLLLELLMLEVDAVPSVIAGTVSDEARESVVLDAVALHDKIKSPHCLLCNDGREYPNPRLLFIHFQRCHVKRANVNCVLPSLMCRLSCKGFGRGHYHCPLCCFVIHDLTKLKVHQQKIHRAALQCAQTELAAGRTITPEALAAALDGSASQTLDKVCRGGLIRGKNRPQGDQADEEDREEEGGSPPLPVSIVQDITAARSRLALPDCYLCRSHRDFFTEKRLLDHFERAHVKRAIDYPPYSILSCHLYNDKYRDRGHYHCPWCWFTSHDKHMIHAHLENHSSKMELARRRVSALPQGRTRGGLSEALLPCAGPLLDKAQVRAWQRRFHMFLKRCLASKSKTSLHMMERRTRQAIVRHLARGAPLSSSLVPHTALRNFKVVHRPALGMRLVERTPTLQMEVDEVAAPRCPDDASVRSGCRSLSGGARSQCTSKPSFRRVACVEEFFTILYGLHVTASGGHVPARQMTRQLERKYSHIPRSVTRKFLNFCPECGIAARLLAPKNAKRSQAAKLPCPNVPLKPKLAGEVGAAGAGVPIRRVVVEMFDGRRSLQEQLGMDDSVSEDDSNVLKQGARCTGAPPLNSPNVNSQEDANSINSSAMLPASRFMDLMLVNVIDMRDYPDVGHQYIVHCQDAHTQLHFLIALRQLRTREIAHAIISKVVSVTGLPSLIVSSSGAEFVESLVTQIGLVWNGSCASLLANCKSLSAASPRAEDVSDSSDVVRELTSRILAAVAAGRPVLWTAWLPHIQYTLNTQTKLPQLTPFQVVFRRSVCPPEVKSDASNPLQSELFSPGITSHQCSAPPRSEGLERDDIGSKDMNSTGIEILDVTAGGFLMDDGVLSHVEVILPKSSNANSPGTEADFSMPSVDLLGVDEESTVNVMHPFSHFSVSATGDVLASTITEDLSPNVGNLDTVKDVPVEDAFTVGNAITGEGVVAGRDVVPVGDAMTVDDFMAIDNTVTVESVADGLADSASIFSSAQNNRVEIFPTLEAVVEDGENYFC